MRPFDHAWNLLKSYTSGPALRTRARGLPTPTAHMRQGRDRSTATIMPQEGDDDFGQPHDPYGTGEDMFDTPEMRRRITEYFAQKNVEKPVLM
jgi:hypothetical protein